MADEQTPAAPDISKTTIVDAQGATQTGLTSATAHIPSDGSRPDWLPEGVESVDGLKEYFQKQEAAARGETPAEEAPTEEPKTVEGEEPKTEDAPAKSDAEIIEALNKAGGIYANPDYQPFGLEFEKTGALSPESITAAAAKFTNGNEDLVKAFVEAQTGARAAVAQAATATAAAEAAGVDRANAEQRASLMAITGGEEQFKSFQGWAAENLSAQEKAAFDNSDPTVAPILLKAYVDRARQAGWGEGARDITAEGQPAPEGSRGGPAPYASQAEMKADMNNPLYARDAAFRAKVAQRVAVTK